MSITLRRQRRTFSAYSECIFSHNIYMSHRISALSTARHERMNEWTDWQKCQSLWLIDRSIDCLIYRLFFYSIIYLFLHSLYIFSMMICLQGSKMMASFLIHSLWQMELSKVVFLLQHCSAWCFLPCLQMLLRMVTLVYLWGISLMGNFST